MSGFKSGLNPNDVAQECRKLGIKSIFTDKVPALPRCPRQDDLTCHLPCDNFTDCYIQQHAAMECG